MAASGGARPGPRRWEKVQKSSPPAEAEAEDEDGFWDVFPTSSPAPNTAAIPQPQQRETPQDKAGSAEPELVMDKETETAREEERQSLEAIYGSDFEVVSEAEWLVHLAEDAMLRVYLPMAYPRMEPPTLVVERAVPPAGLVERMVEDWTPGEVCVYQWAEELRDALAAAADLATPLANCESDEVLARALAESLAEEADAGAGLEYVEVGQPGRAQDPRCRPEILHGEPIVDRKSTFIAHLAPVGSMEEVAWVQQELLLDKKIAAATHNIVAFRFRDEAKGIVVADNDDDGETAAGSRLAQLLELRGVMGVYVMVSRWYGGIQLGPDRFKHINRAAQHLLDQAATSLPAAAQGGPQKPPRKAR